MRTALNLGHALRASAVFSFGVAVSVRRLAGDGEDLRTLKFADTEIKSAELLGAGTFVGPGAATPRELGSYPIRSVHDQVSRSGWEISLRPKPKTHLVSKLHQILHQIARAKGSKTSFLLRVFL
jgi:hypothetical protein